MSETIKYRCKRCSRELFLQEKACPVCGGMHNTPVSDMLDSLQSQLSEASASIEKMQERLIELQDPAFVRVSREELRALVESSIPDTADPCEGYLELAINDLDEGYGSV